MDRAEALNQWVSPMQPIIEQVMGQMHTEYENGVMRAVQSVGFNVDKDRLLQALTDARAFYEEGYNAALREQEQRGQGCEWCNDLDRMYEVVCYLPHDNGNATDIPINFCPVCGCKLTEPPKEGADG